MAILTFAQLLEASCGKQREFLIPATISKNVNKKTNKMNVFVNVLGIKDRSHGRPIDNKVNINDYEDGQEVYIPLDKQALCSLIYDGVVFGHVNNLKEAHEVAGSFEGIKDAIIALRNTLNYDSLLDEKALDKIKEGKCVVHIGHLKSLYPTIEDNFQQLIKDREIVLNYEIGLQQLETDYKSMEKELHTNFKVQEQELLQQEQALNGEIDKKKKELDALDNSRKSLINEIEDLTKFKEENKWLEEIKNIVEPSQNIIKPSGKSLNKGLFDDLVNNLVTQQNISEHFAKCYILSVLTSLINGRFLLLTGHIGTGKSKIIKDTGKLLGGKTNMIAVRPAWLDASDLLGYFDPINTTYHKTDFVNYLQEPDDDRIHMILLDEMNIARVENYGADILANLSSIYEREDGNSKIHLYSKDLEEKVLTAKMYHDLPTDKQKEHEDLWERCKQPHEIVIPKNVLFCGTLNIDGTTENLSPKMIDRSFLIKFPDFDGKLVLENTDERILNMSISALIKEDNQFEKLINDERYINLWKKFYDGFINNIKDCLIPISRRVAYDYIVYSILSKKLGVTIQLSNIYFFYARILCRLLCQDLDNDKKQKIIDVLNSFNQTELFLTFIQEIKKHDGGYIDFQQICG